MPHTPSYTEMTPEQLCKLPRIWLYRITVLPGNVRRICFHCWAGGYYYTDLIGFYDMYYGNTAVRVRAKAEGNGFYMQHLEESQIIPLSDQNEIWLARFSHVETGASSWIAGIYDVRDPLQEWPTPHCPLFECEAKGKEDALDQVRAWAQQHASK